MRLAALLLVVWIIVLVAGCAGKKATPNPYSFPQSTAPQSSGKTNAIVTPSANRSGRVVSVNPGARFAVVRFPLGQMPRLEERMNIFRNGLKVGELKISGPQRDVLAVGDIVAGDCQVDDEIRSQ